MSCSVRCAHCRICFCNKGEECWFSHGGPASKHPPPPADYQWQHSSPLLQGISDGLIPISPYLAQSCMYQQWSANLHFPYDQVCNAVCFCFCSCFCFCFCVCFLSASASAATISVSECFCCNDMIWCYKSTASVLQKQAVGGLLLCRFLRWDLSQSSGVYWYIQCSVQDKVARQSRFLEIADFLEASLCRQLLRH